MTVPFVSCVVCWTEFVPPVTLEYRDVSARPDQAAPLVSR